MSRRKMRLLVTLVGVLSVLGVSFVAASPAMAADGCYGDYCSGRNPYITGVGGVPCANDGRPVSSADINSAGGQLGPITIGGNRVGVVQLMWSPRRQTNWAQLNTSQPGNYRHLTVLQNGGYAQTNELLGIGHYSLPSGIYATNMIYSPTLAAQAYVNTPPWWVATLWV